MRRNLLTRSLGLFLALIMVFSMVGCGATSTPAASSVASSSAVEPTVETMEGDEFGNGAIGAHGAVSSYDEYSSQIGLDILKAGGNAVDAAVATAFAIGVVEPHHSGIGGCGMMTIYLKELNKYIVIDYMETTPAGITPGWYNPETDSNTAKNAAIPGQVYGLLSALEEYGTMSREEVMAPAIALARDGFTMDSIVSAAIADSFDLFSAEGNEYLLKTYSNEGLPYSAGETFKNPDLADTLQKIADGGIEEFYEGELAQTIVDGLQKGGSLITMEDMAAYKSEEREPISTDYYGYDVVTVPPPSNGGDWLLEMLNIMEEEDIASLDVNSPEYLYAFNEACRIGLTDTYSYIGDPAFFDLPTEEMISQDFAKERATLIKNDGTILEEIPESNLTVTKLDVGNTAESKNTSHIAVIDDFGNIVSTTNTIGNGWGCKFMVEGTGFFFNSHIGNLNHTDPESPDYIMPGKRVRSTISPTIVLKDGEPVMAVGSPGSLSIPPAIAAVINNTLLYDMNVQQAINLPRAFAISRSKGKVTNTLTAETGRFDAETLSALEGYGYVFKDGVSDYDMATGGIAAIYLNKEDGKFYAGADPRREYKALAY